MLSSIFLYKLYLVFSRVPQNVADWWVHHVRKDSSKRGITISYMIFVLKKTFVFTPPFASYKIFHQRVEFSLLWAPLETVSYNSLSPWSIRGLGHCTLKMKNLRSDVERPDPKSIRWLVAKFWQQPHLLALVEFFCSSTPLSLDRKCPEDSNWANCRWDYTH